jgi:hypothetical protein
VRARRAHLRHERVSRSGQAWGLSGGDPPNPPCCRRGRTYGLTSLVLASLAASRISPTFSLSASGRTRSSPTRWATTRARSSESSQKPLSCIAPSNKPTSSRHGVYFHDEGQEAVVRAALERMPGAVTECEQASRFYDGEEYVIFLTRWEGERSSVGARALLRRKRARERAVGGRPPEPPAPSTPRLTLDATQVPPAVPYERGAECGQGGHRDDPLLRVTHNLDVSLHMSCECGRSAQGVCVLFSFFRGPFLFAIVFPLSSLLLRACASPLHLVVAR